MYKFALPIFILIFIACNSATDKKIDSPTLLIDSSKIVQQAKPVEKIKEELDMNDNVFQNTLTNLRKKNVIVDGEISKFYIPDLDLKSKNFKVIFNFNILDNEK